MICKLSTLRTYWRERRFKSKVWSCSGSIENRKIIQGSYRPWQQDYMAGAHVLTPRSMSQSAKCIQVNLSMRIDRTFTNSVLTRDSKTVIEVVSNTSTLSQMKPKLAYIFQKRSATKCTDNLVEKFHEPLDLQLSLNQCYRKAYIIKPVI